MASKWTSSDVPGLLCIFYLLWTKFLSLNVFTTLLCIIYKSRIQIFKPHTNIFKFQFPLFWIFCRLGFCRFVCSILQISIYAWAEENGEGDKIVKYFLFSLRLDSDSNQILWKPDQRTEGWQPVCRTQRMCRHWKNRNPWCSHLVYFSCSPNILTDITLENHWLVSHFTIPIWNKWFYQISQVISSSLINFSYHPIRGYLLIGKRGANQ